MATALDQAKQRLQSFGIRPSLQRLTIMEYMLSVRSHPTAEMVYRALEGEMTTLSKATVYNTLNLLSEKGAITPITIDATERRFDGFIEPHAHFRCQNCGELHDIEITEKLSEALEGFNSLHTILTKEIYLTGICLKCKTNNTK